jgi:hypothetical protein
VWPPVRSEACASCSVEVERQRPARRRAGAAREASAAWGRRGNRDRERAGRFGRTQRLRVAIRWANRQVVVIAAGTRADAMVGEVSDVTISSACRTGRSPLHRERQRGHRGRRRGFGIDFPVLVWRWNPLRRARV